MTSDPAMVEYAERVLADEIPKPVMNFMGVPLSDLSREAVERVACVSVRETANARLQGREDRRFMGGLRDAVGG